MINTCFNIKKAVLASQVKNLLVLDKSIKFFDFSNLDKFLFILLDLLPSTNSSFSATPTHISEFCNELAIFNMDISNPAILLNL